MTLANMLAQGVHSLWAVRELCPLPSRSSVECGRLWRCGPGACVRPPHGLYPLRRHWRPRQAELAGTAAAREPDRPAVELRPSGGSGPRLRGHQYGQRCSVVARDLLIDAVQVRRSGAFSHIELACNFPVRQSFHYQKHHFALVSRQPIRDFPSYDIHARAFVRQQRPRRGYGHCASTLFDNNPGADARRAARTR